MAENKNIVLYYYNEITKTYNKQNIYILKGNIIHKNDVPMYIVNDYDNTQNKIKIDNLTFVTDNFINKINEEIEDLFKLLRHNKYYKIENGYILQNKNINDKIIFNIQYDKDHEYELYISNSHKCYMSCDFILKDITLSINDLKELKDNCFTENFIDKKLINIIVKSYTYKIIINENTMIPYEEEYNNEHIKVYHHNKILDQIILGYTKELNDDLIYAIIKFSIKNKIFTYINYNIFAEEIIFANEDYYDIDINEKLITLRMNDIELINNNE